MTDVVSQYVSGRTVQEQMCELMKFVSTVNGKSVKKIEGSQSDDTVTVTVTYEDDRTDVFSFVATSGVTRDTAQTISGMKVFSSDTTQFTHEVDIGGVLNVADTAEINVLEVDTNATIGGDETVDGNLSVGGNVAITGNVTTDLNVVGDIANHHMAIEEYNGDTVLAVEQNLILNDGTTVPTSDSSGKVATTKWVQDARNADASIVRTTGNQTMAGVKDFTSKTTGPYFGYIWCEYPKPSQNWCLIATHNGANQYIEVEVTSSNAQYAKAIFYGSTSGINGYAVATVEATGISVGVGYENGNTMVYLKVPAERNWTVRVHSWDRYRNGVPFTVSTALPADAHRDTLPTVSGSVTF